MEINKEQLHCDTVSMTSAEQTLRMILPLRALTVRFCAAMHGPMWFPAAYRAEKRVRRALCGAE